MAMRPRFSFRDLRADIRHTFRQIHRAPGFAAIVIATLALTIGANTLVFSVVNALRLRTLPVAEPQQLVVVSTASAALADGQPVGRSYAMWEQIRRQAEAGTFGGALTWSGVGEGLRFILARGGNAEPANGLFVSGEFFSTLGVRAWLGRTFTAADDVHGGGRSGPVAVISHGLWQRRFAGAADVLGRPLLVDGVTFTIVGVTPPGFLGVEVGRAFDVALPIGTEPLLHGDDSWLGIRFLTVMLRLKPGQSVGAAQDALRAMQPQIAEAAGDFEQPFLQDPLALVPGAAGTSPLRGQFTRPLTTILAIAGLVLLIACANIANPMLARAMMRRHEMSVRLALGASRWRLARQFLVESLFHAGCGGLLGLLFAQWGSQLLTTQLSTWFDSVILPVPLDWRVMAFTGGVAVATALIFGLVPAFHTSRVPPIGVLDARASTPPGLFATRRVAVTGWLVIAQVAVSLVLVMASGLLVGTFGQLASRALGFEKDRVLVIDVDATRATADATQRLPLYQRIGRHPRLARRTRGCGSRPAEELTNRLAEPVPELDGDPAQG